MIFNSIMTIYSVMALPSTCYKREVQFWGSDVWVHRSFADRGRV
jgi:hypothetical protein